jgi:hypothetical protein
MNFGTSTLLAVFLIILAASLSSYLLSQWLAARNRSKSLAWAGVSVGTLLFLAAAVLVVLSISVLAPLHFGARDELSQPMIEPAQSSSAIAQSAAASQAMTPSEPASAARGRTTSRATNGEEPRKRSFEDAIGPEPVATIASQQSHGEFPGHGATTTRAGSVVPVAADPWAATRCVRAFHIDPSDLLRWTIENECGRPVGILIAACLQSASECNERQSTSWKYQRGGMILPGKAQRPVSDAEQTRRGQQVRFLACFITIPEAIQLIGQPIGQPIDMSSDAAASGQFQAVLDQDECLARVQRWSDEGNRTGLSIDALLGGPLPQNAFPPP